MNVLDKIKELGIPVVKAIGSFSSAEEVLAHTKPLLKAEGFVIAFADGRVKVKADQYVRIHRVKDQIRYDRNILALILNSELDDVLPILDDEDRATVRTYEQSFWELVANCETRLELLCKYATDVLEGDKKRIALEMGPSLKIKEDLRYMFLMVDGKKAHDLILEQMTKSVNNGPKYDEAMKWLASPPYEV